MSGDVPGDKKNVPLARSPKQGLRQRIEAFLEANAPNEFNLKTIAAHMKGVKVAAVKKSIQRALLDPKSNIVKVHEGWYRTAKTPEVLSKVSTAKRLGIHGIEIAGKCPDDPTRSRLLRDSEFKINHNGQYSFEFLGRSITITLYPKSPTILVQLSATNNPLTFEEFNGFCFWLFGWGATAKILDHTWQVLQYGWNVDYINLDMTKSGYKRITLKAFRNDYFQIYQKHKDVVRFEAHLNPRDMSLTDMQRCVMILMAALGDGKGKGEAATPTQVLPPDNPEGYA